MPIPSTIYNQLNEEVYKNKKLYLRGKHLTDKDIKVLVKLIKKNPSITNLDLRDNKLTDTSTPRLAALSQLKELCLSGNKAITTEGYRAFLSNGTLTKLPIVGGSGAERKIIRAHIRTNPKSMLASDKLSIPTATKQMLKQGTYNSKTLNLDSRKIRDVDIDELVDLIKKNPTIECLFLRKNKLSDTSAPKLAALTQLKELYLTGNNISINKGYIAFLHNYTLTKLPIIGGSGADIKRIREHIKTNPKVPKNAETVDVKKPVISTSKPPVSIPEEVSASQHTKINKVSLITPDNNPKMELKGEEDKPVNDERGSRF